MIKGRFDEENMILNLYYSDRLLISIPYEFVPNGYKVCSYCTLHDFCKRPMPGLIDEFGFPGTYKTFCSKVSELFRPDSKIPGKLLRGITGGHIIKKMPKRFRK